jgi:hypothetical protein
MTKIPSSEILRVAKVMHRANKQYGLDHKIDALRRRPWQDLSDFDMTNYLVVAEAAIRELLRKPIRLVK